MNIIHGAKGFTWFHYFEATPPENIATLNEFMQDIDLLTPVVLGADETSYDVTLSLAGSGRVDYMVRQFDSCLFIFAASTRVAGETATFSVPGLANGTVIDVYGEGRTIVAGSGQFSDVFGELGVHIYIIPLAEPVDVAYQIEASEDDDSCNAWYNSPTSEFLSYPHSSDGRRAFMRWQLDIPAGSVINSAYIQVKAYAGASNDTTVRLQAIDSNSCPDFASAVAYNWAVTATLADWAMTPWITGSWYNSPDISDLVQEFVDRPGYQSGNYFGLRTSFVSGAYRRACTFDKSPDDGAVLVINYTPAN